MDTKLIVSASPHLRSEETTTGLMANVIVALVPCVVASAIIFGLRALLVTAVSVVASVAFEWLYCKLLKKPNPVGDLSAVVTGIILALNVPVGMPIGELIVGDFVAIIVVKQLFGGIGMNFANPALVGRIFLFISFAGEMNTWVYPDAAVDQLSSATPLKVADPSKLSLLDLFMGVHGGVLGETCALAIVLGLIYLVATKTISAAIPASYIGSMFIFYLISTRSLHGALVGVLSGGLLFGAVYMATDYVTSPFTLKGKLVYGVALGIVTFAIREWGSYAEGVSFALLFMNLWVPYINDLTRQTPVWLYQTRKTCKGGCWQMNKTTWESTVKPVVVLSVISLVVSLLLAVVNSMTAPVIAENERAATLAAYVDVMPSVSDANTLEEVSGYTTANVSGAVKAEDGSMAIKAGESGFDGGVLTVIMGFDTEGKVTGIWVDASTQTSGIGSNVAKADYLAQFNGMDGTQNIVMNQDFDATAALPFRPRLCLQPSTTASAATMSWHKRRLVRNGI